MPTIERTLKLNKQAVSFDLIERLYKSNLTKNQFYILLLLRRMHSIKQTINRSNFFTYFNHLVERQTNNNWQYAKQYLITTTSKQPHNYRLTHKAKIFIDSFE